MVCCSELKSLYDYLIDYNWVFNATNYYTGNFESYFIKKIKKIIPTVKLIYLKDLHNISRLVHILCWFSLRFQTIITISEDKNLILKFNWTLNFNIKNASRSPEAFYWLLNAPTAILPLQIMPYRITHWVFIEMRYSSKMRWIGKQWDMRAVIWHNNIARRRPLVQCSLCLKNW